MNYICYGVILFLCLAFVYWVGFALIYKRALDNCFIVVKGINSVKVSDRGLLSFPFVNSYSYVDARHKKITVESFEDYSYDSLLTKDGVSVNYRLDFYISVDYDHVLHCLSSFGAYGVNDNEFLLTHFRPLFLAAMQEASMKFSYKELESLRSEYRDAVCSILGRELFGFKLQDVAITYLSEDLTCKREIETIETK